MIKLCLSNSVHKTLFAFNIAVNPEYDGYQHRLASMVYKLFDKNSAGVNTSGGAIESEIMWNKQLAKKKIPLKIFR